MRLFKRSPQPVRRRRGLTLSKRIATALKDADTYVFSGLAAMSSGAGLGIGTVFGTALGVAGGLAIAGACTFGLGVWLLPPRRGNP